MKVLQLGGKNFRILDRVNLLHLIRVRVLTLERILGLGSSLQYNLIQL